MECLHECCTSRRKLTFKEKSKAIKPNKEPELFKCALFECLKTTQNIHLWRSAIVRKTMFKFCSDECWNTWINSNQPSPVLSITSLRLSAMSPLSLANSPNVPPAIIHCNIPMLAI
jgi:hypothetical protein